MRDMKMQHKEKCRAGKCEKSQYGKRTHTLYSIKWIIVYWHNKKQTRRTYLLNMSKNIQNALIEFWDEPDIYKN